MSLMNTSSEQPVMQEMSQKHSNDIAIKEVLKLVALSRFLQENPHEMWSYCNVNGCSVSWKQLHSFCQMIIPKPKQSDSFADQLLACTRQIMCYINSELSPVVGTTYRDLRQFVEAIDMSRYFECGFAGGRLIDDEFEARSSSDVNICDNDRQLSVDDTLGEVMTPLTDADQINTSQSDVNKLPAVLNVNVQRGRGRVKSGRPSSCLYCGKRFPTPTALNTHVRTHTGHRPYVCSQCSRGFTQLCHLTRHVHHRHAIIKPYVCAYCHKPFAAAALLRSHLRSHGLVTRAPSRRIVQYACDVCGLQTRKRHRLICHIRVHTREQPYLCSECGRSFASASYLCRHQQSHMSPMAVPCLLCDKVFASVQLLRQHQTTHTDSRPHVCSLCGRAFKRVGDLRTHWRVHSGQRPYVCELCSATFTQTSSLKYHVLAHCNQRAHTCRVCGRCFITAHKLRVHALVHTGERPHACDKCGRNFGDRSSFRRHMRIHAFKKDIP